MLWRCDVNISIVSIPVNSHLPTSFVSGFFGVVTDFVKKSAEYFDARETAPSGLTAEFYRSKVGTGTGYVGRTGTAIIHNTL